ncbi:MAG: sulfur carrier protein ThiS [Rikenellaceae bacterium]
MKIILNNVEQQSNSQNLADLLDEFQIETKGIAVGLNSRVVARTSWATTPINEGDKVVIVSAVFGG